MSSSISLREGIRLYLEDEGSGQDAPPHSPLQVKTAVLSDNASA
jgi:hypothetical protein